MKITLIGTVDNAPDVLSVAEFECAANMTADDLIAGLKQAATDYLITCVRDDGDAEMPYPYNFGDVIEMCDEDPSFRDYLSGFGITYVNAYNGNFRHVDHDEIWVSDDEVNAYAR